MDTNLIKNQLQYSIPEELFSIEPGQIVFFVPSDGRISMEELSTLEDFFYCLRAAFRIDSFEVSLVPTSNQLLIATIAGRNPQEIDTPYKVFVGAWDSIPGIVSQYFGEDVEKIVGELRTPKWRRIKTDSPAIVTIDPANRPAQKQHKDIDQSVDSSYQSGYDMELKIAKPEPGSKAEKALKTRMERKLEKVLRDCAILDIELDVDRIKQKVINSLKSTIEYKLALNIKTIKEDSLSFCTVCDIYVAEGEEYKLDLTAGEKAVYLTFMLYEDGIRIKETAESSFRSITQKIYNQLPDDNKCEKTAGGILDTGDVIYDVYEKTLRSDISRIRAEIDDKIANPLIAQDFAIEGFKDKEFGISYSTPELRAQIKQAFDL